MALARVKAAIGVYLAQGCCNATNIGWDGEGTAYSLRPYQEKTEGDMVDRLCLAARAWL